MNAHLFSARTIHQADTGYSIIKVTKFNQTLEHLQLLTERLRKFSCILYDYTHMSVDGDELTIERDRVEGTALDSLHEYTGAVFPTFSALMGSYRRACNLFEERGFGFIITDYKELSNVIVESGGEMQLIDFEDSFVVTTDQDLWFRYWDIAIQHSDLELERTALLSTL